MLVSIYPRYDYTYLRSVYLTLKLKEQFLYEIVISKCGRYHFPRVICCYPIFMIIIFMMMLMMVVVVVVMMMMMMMMITMIHNDV